MEKYKYCVYSMGVVSASVCAVNELTDQEVTDILNTEYPTNIPSKWAISKDKTFKTGQSNPCPCEDYPETHRHILFNC